MKILCLDKVIKYIFDSDLVLRMRRIYFCNQKSLKRMFKTGFPVQNHPLNLCSHAVNSQRLLCSQKAWCETFVLKLSGYTNIFIYIIASLYCTILLF